MKKNEKFLALLLSVVMILTCFVGAVTVNAENATPTATIVVTADAVEVGATEIPVTLTVTSETGINEALIKVSSDLGDIIAQPTVEANTPADADNTEGAANYNAFYLSARNVDDGTGNTTLGAITTATIKVVFTRTEAIVAGTYNVDVEIPEGKVIAASKDEVAIDLVCDGLEIVVAEAVTDCEHANIQYVSHVNATETAPGSITYTCDDCNETITEEVVYNNSYRVRGANAAYKAEIVLNFNLYIDEWSTTADLSKSFGILTKENNKTADADSITKVIRVSDTSIDESNKNHTVRVLSYPCAARELADNIDYSLIAYVDGVWYCGKTGTYSFATYANSTLGKTTVLATEKKLLADILNYGTESQIYFDYNASNPLNKVYASFDGYIATYATKAEDDRETVKLQEISNTGSTYRIGAASASFESRAEMNIRINNADKSVFNGSTDDIVVTITYNDAIEGMKTIRATEFFVTGGQTYARFAELYSYQVSDPVNVKLYNAATYVEGSDANVAEAELTYSLETYAHNKINSTESIKTLCRMLVRYGDSSYAHFVGAK